MDEFEGFHDAQSDDGRSNAGDSEADERAGDGPDGKDIEQQSEAEGADHCFGGFEPRKFVGDPPQRTGSAAGGGVEEVGRIHGGN